MKSPAKENASTFEQSTADTTSETLESERCVSASRIADLFLQLDNLNHYQLLGVSQNASSKSIRSAYFRLTQEFHPDRYFANDISSQRDKLQVIFTRINQAHETLTKTKSRSAYDETLHANASISSTPSNSVNPVRTTAAPESRRRGLARKLGRTNSSEPRRASSLKPTSRGRGDSLSTPSGKCRS